MCLVLDKFRCLIDFIRALEGSKEDLIEKTKLEQMSFSSY